MRLIDADAMCEGLVSNHPVAIAAACAPTVDAVEVVRCKDCKYHRDALEGFIYCMFNARRTRIDGYCNDGKRMVAEVQDD